MQQGIRTGNPELGLAALEFSRASFRGICCRVVIEVEEEPDLVASIDAIRDVTNPSAEERQDSILREDILHRFRKKARQLQRALLLLLTEQHFAEMFGYRDELLAQAVRRLLATQLQTRLRTLITARR